MCKLTLATILLFIVSFQLTAQESYYTQSGYTSLTIKLSGDYPDTIDISIPHLWNPLAQEKPNQFETVNDSTYAISAFTFGPSPIYFIFDNHYLSSVLLPNQSDILQIHYADATNYTMDYQGYFKEIFDHSPLLPELIKNAFEYSGESSTKTGIVAAFKSANEFRDTRLEYIGKMITALSKDIESPALKQYYTTGMIDNFKSALLVDDYKTSVEIYNRNIGLDSLDVLRHIPERDRSYYDSIIDRQYADTASLLSGAYYKFLSDIRKDSLLDLPSISRVGPSDYRSKLDELFGHIFSQGDNLFYDMMIANAYIAQIEAGNLLSNQEKYNVGQYFENRHISNYILYQNDLNAQQRANTTTGKYYFPFKQERDSVMMDILSRYKEKVIVMDFWATWCGPCIAAHSEMKNVKIRYADRDDVIFIYITNESSSYGKWNDYVNVLGGEHYYLYNNQNDIIGEQYKIKYLPSYLIFNKKGELSASNLDGGYMGNEKTIMWIEKALNE